MTNIELQAYEAVKSIARQTARIADALEAIIARMDAEDGVDNPNRHKGEVSNV